MINFAANDEGKEKIYEIESNDSEASKSPDKVNQILSEIKEMNYTDDHKRFRIQILESNIAENEDMFKRIASLNNQWWRS